MIKENAIHRLLLLRHRKGNTELLNESLDMAIEALRQPERKTGKWVKKVDDGVYWYECSECGDYPLKSAFGYDYFSEWCPHCGAKLEGVEECQR